MPNKQTERHTNRQQKIRQRDRQTDGRTNGRTERKGEQNCGMEYRIPCKNSFIITIMFGYKLLTLKLAKNVPLILNVPTNNDNNDETARQFQ